MWEQKDRNINTYFKISEAISNIPNKLLFTLGLYSPTPTPKLEGHPLSPNGYSIYSQLPPIPGGIIFHPQPERFVPY
jgi:hypothetical protein